MWITIGGVDSVEIDDAVVRRVLNLYPEEKLEEREVFVNSLATGRVALSDLKAESDKILIPWQMFLLTSSNFGQEKQHIDRQRQRKVASKLMAKRKGAGAVTSRRIIDRLIRQQDFVISQGRYGVNSFCGSLKGLRAPAAAQKLLDHFGVDRGRFWGFSSKGRALEHLIDLVEARHINVSRGTTAHKLLPNFRVVPSEVYRSTSGFVIRDERVPFVFLPSEINPDEIDGRQIYTLVYLLAIIGTEQYGYVLDSDFRAKMVTAKGVQARLHEIATELLMPSVELDRLRGEEITGVVRDTLADKYKVSPSALVTTLLMRGLISQLEYEALKPPPFVLGRSPARRRTPKITTAVRKLCGRLSFEAINTAVSSGTLRSVPAQYLIFGGVNKRAFREYRSLLGI